MTSNPQRTAQYRALFRLWRVSDGGSLGYEWIDFIDRTPQGWLCAVPSGGRVHLEEVHKADIDLHVWGFEEVIEDGERKMYHCDPEYVLQPEPAEGGPS